MVLSCEVKITLFMISGLWPGNQSLCQLNYVYSYCSLLSALLNSLRIMTRFPCVNLRRMCLVVFFGGPHSGYHFSLYEGMFGISENPRKLFLCPYSITDIWYFNSNSSWQIFQTLILMRQLMFSIPHSTWSAFHLKELKWGIFWWMRCSLKINYSALTLWEPMCF